MSEKVVPFTTEFRPKSLATMVGQAKLKNGVGAILRTGRIPSAIGLYGDSSAGKTTSARILARALLCINPTKETGDACGECVSCLAFDKRHHDYIEVNAAKERGVDAMRDLATKIQMRPTVGPFRVVLLDEAHKITNDAWNAMLKVLEEPPEHVRFIIATTDPQKIPGTIDNRLLKFKLEPLTTADVVEMLKRIYDAKNMAEEGVTMEDLQAIAIASRRVPRTAITALDHLYTMVIDANLMGKKPDRDTITTFVKDVTTSDAEIDAGVVMKSILTGKPINALNTLFQYQAEGSVILDHLWSMSRALLTYALEPAVFAEQTPFYAALTTNNKGGKAGAPLAIWATPNAAQVMLSIHEAFTKALKDTSDYTVPAGKVLLAVVTNCVLLVKNAKTPPALSSEDAKAVLIATGAIREPKVAKEDSNDDPMAALNQKNHRTKV